MSYFSTLLRGAQISDVYVDNELTYIMLANGTQITVCGTVIVEPALVPTQCAEGSDQ